MVCRFGGILLHADRFKHINNVARILLQETGLGQKVQHACEGKDSVCSPYEDFLLHVKYIQFS